MSFGSFLKLITRIIDAHSRKFLITHYASLFEYLLIFNEYKKKKKTIKNFQFDKNGNNKDCIGFKSCFAIK